MKALIPAAGHGTRFLPVTRVVPKEMLPVGSKPAIQLIVEEALAAGADEVVIVTSRDKEIIKRYFDGDPDLAKRIRWAYQTEQRGLGHAVLQAADALAAEGVEARVIDMHTIKPLDVDCVMGCINDIGKIITVEDHNILNGLGSAVCELAAEAGRGRVRRIGIQDQFGQSAPYERLLKMNGVTVEDIVAAARAL